jgi:hypothetical protein
LTAWFLNLPLDEYIDTTKAQSLNFESKTYEAQLEEQNTEKAQKGHLKEGNTAKPTNGAKSDNPRKEQGKAQKQNKTSNKSSNSKPPLNQTPTNKLNTSSPP